MYETNFPEVSAESKDKPKLMNNWNNLENSAISEQIIQDARTEEGLYNFGFIEVCVKLSRQKCSKS